MLIDILAAQAQKHVTHNEAIRLLDGLVQMSVIDSDLAAPPGSPADGARYIVAAGATGAWAGWDSNIAYHVDGAWMRLIQRRGWMAWIEDETQYRLWNGTAWQVVLGSGGVPGGIYFNGATGSFDVTSTAAYATKGLFFQPLVELAVSHVWARVDSAAEGNSYYAQIAEVTSPDASGTVVQILGTTEIKSTGSTDPRSLRLAFPSPVTLTAGKSYVITITYDQASGTGALRVSTASTTSSSGGWDINAPGLTIIGAAQYNTVGLSVSQAPSVIGTGVYGIHIEGLMDLPVTVTGTTVHAADGTAANPALSFLADTDTGLYRPAADQIGLATGGVLRALLSGAALQIDVPVTGTAVQSSPTDTTAGRLMQVGAFGLGATNPVIGNAGVVDNSVPPGFWGYNTAAGSSAGPVGPTTGLLLHQRRDAGGGEAQIFVDEVSGNNQLHFRSRSAAAWSAWHRVVHRENLLGTVSQSAGVPTGAVIERGSNANGEYVRFADGTQICTQAFVSANPSNLALGTIFNSAEETWNFPSTFIATPRVHIAVRGGNQWGNVRPTSASAALAHIFTATSSSAIGWVFDLTAIGRWF